MATKNKRYLENRILEEADYIIENKATIRETAENFEVCKSTIHYDMNEKLPDLDLGKYLYVRKIMKKNEKERPERVSKALKRKWRE